MSDPVMVGGATPAASGSKRLLVLGGGAVALLLLALVLPKLLFGGGDEAADDFADFPVTTPTTAVVADPAVDDTPEPARTFEVFSTKNPFTPLRDLTPATAATTGTTGTATTGTAGTGTTGTTVAPASGSISPIASTTPTTIAPSNEPVSGQRVALLEVFVDDASKTVASVRVNDTVHEVAEGAMFATRYEAVTLSVADGCGQFLYGDAAFRLCEGEELLK